MRRFQFISIILIAALSARNFVLAAESSQSHKTAPQEKPHRELVDAENSFDNGHFSLAEQQADGCLKQLSFYAPSEKGRLFLLKARLSFAFQRKSEMESWLRESYQADPNVQVSRLKDPPELVSLLQILQNDAGKSVASAPVSSVTSAAPKTDSLSANSQNEKPFDADLKSDARFILGVMPFGIGHFVNNQVWPGASFMLAESTLFMLSSGLAETTQKRSSENILSAFSRDNERFNDQATAYNLLGASGFLGLWGLEVLHILPTLAKENPTGARWARFATSFAPFGVAQFKNGEKSKALGLAAAEAIFLLLCGSLPLEGQRTLAKTFFAGSLIFGMTDGWLNHDWQVDPGKTTPWNVTLLPQTSDDLRATAWVLSISFENL